MGRAGRWRSPTAKAAAPPITQGIGCPQIVMNGASAWTRKRGHAYIPINAEARKVANSWDPAKDEAEGNQCKAYDAVGVMQRPGRLHITWVDDNTLQIDADAGTQDSPGALWRHSKQNPRARLAGKVFRKRHGTYHASDASSRSPAARANTLKVVTTNMKPGISARMACRTAPTRC